MLNVNMVCDGPASISCLSVLKLAMLDDKGGRLELRLGAPVAFTFGPFSSRTGLRRDRLKRPS